MPNTPRNQWPVPEENEDPFFTAFTDMTTAIDATVYAQKENTETVLMGGGTISWNAGTGVLSWSAVIEIPATQTGFLWQIPIGSVTIPDGSLFYIAVTHAPQNNMSVTPVVASQLPVGDAYLVLGFRRGTVVHFRNGSVINNGSASGIFDSGTVANPYTPEGGLFTINGGIEATSITANASLTVPILNDTTRGAAGLQGRIIFNTTDGKLNIDDGTNWTLPDGTIT